MEIIDPKPTGTPVMNETPRYTTYQAPQPEEQKPDNFLTWAILSTILCCLPFGVVAIINASQVDSAWFAGNREAARQAAKRARTWTWVAFGTGAFGIVAYLLVLLIVALTSGF